MTRSQAPFYLCALRTIANRAEGTFALLRYILGGDRPSQTAHIPLFQAQIHGTRLESKYGESGISLTAQPELAPELQSLPPILHRPYLDPIVCYSKGS
jgi:hypothetical protein